MIRTCVVNDAHGPPGYFLKRNGVDVLRCPRCKSLMADVPFDASQYERDEYYTMKFRTREDIERYWGFRWRHVLNALRTRATPSTLLDVGAGNGYFVYMAGKEFGLDAFGIEIAEKEIDFARRVVGIELSKQALEEHDRRDYSVVTLFNVLEHVPDPLSILREAHNHLRPGGYLAVTTPNPSCVHVRVKGLRNWGMVDPPHHINLFTKGGLFGILTRTRFQPTHYETLSTYMEWLLRYDTRNYIARQVLFRVLRALSLGADHLVIARKT